MFFQTSSLSHKKQLDEVTSESDSDDDNFCYEKYFV
jgi:hypothetical protein